MSVCGAQRGGVMARGGTKGTPQLAEWKGALLGQVGRSSLCTMGEAVGSEPSLGCG